MGFLQAKPTRLTKGLRLNSHTKLSLPYQIYLFYYNYKLFFCVHDLRKYVYKNLSNILNLTNLTAIYDFLIILQVIRTTRILHKTGKSIASWGLRPNYLKHFLDNFYRNLYKKYHLRNLGLLLQLVVFLEEGFCFS